MSIAERFGSNLPRCRERAGINKSQIARLTELHATAIGRFEERQSNAPADTLLKLTGALDGRVDELVEGMAGSRTSPPTAALRSPDD